MGLQNQLKLWTQSAKKQEVGERRLEIEVSRSLCHTSINIVLHFYREAVKEEMFVKVNMTIVNWMQTNLFFERKLAVASNISKKYEQL